MMSISMRSRARSTPMALCTATDALRPAPLFARRCVFYRPEIYGMHSKLPAKTGRIWTINNTWMYRPIKRDPLPYPEPAFNNLYGRQRLWNAIPSKFGVASKKAHDWGYPERDPPPKGLRESPEYFPYFFDKYFPDVECRLVLDSVLNVDTTMPVFEFPPHMSKAEIANYLRNVHGFDNIVNVTTRNISGRTYKNEIGVIKQLPDVKLAHVTLDAPVRIDFKQVKTTEESEATMGGAGSRPA
jgi:large subunit ribosomal protein L23